MNYYKATFNDINITYYKTFETNPNKVKNSAIKDEVIHLNIYKKANTNIKEQRKNLTEFKIITELEFNNKRK